MTDSIITGASPIPITPVLSTANVDASVIRAKAEQEVAALRADMAKVETSISTAIKADVSKIEALWQKFKPLALPVMIAWTLGWVAGAFGPHL